MLQYYCQKSSISQKKLSVYDIFSQGQAWESSFLQFDRLWTPFLAKAIDILIENQKRT